MFNNFEHFSLSVLKKVGSSGLELTKCLSEKQTGKTLRRQLLQKQSDLDLLCLSWLFWQATLFKILEHFFPQKRLVIRDGTHKMIVRKANREDPEQAASSEAV